jgi:methyl-accepting chemotaxis protein
MLDADTVETALVVIAVSLAVQTLLLMAGAIAAWVGYQRTRTAVAEEMRELRATTDDIARSLHRAAEAVGRGSDAVGAAVDDARNAVHNVGNWTGTVATAIGTPRAAAAMGVLRGVQWWRRRRQQQRERAAGSLPPEV